jgi:hypothetical protein
MVNLRAALAIAICTQAVVACGGSETNNVTCGSGTTLEGSQCVASSDSGPMVDGASEDHDATTGGEDGPTDAGLDATLDVTPDVTKDADAAQFDANAPDPCPVNDPPHKLEILDDCDPVCCGQDPLCQGSTGEAGQLQFCSDATCGSGPATLQENYGLSFVVRTPGHPGIDPACVSDCPDGGFVYGLGLTLNPQAPAIFDITVGPPWKIIQHSNTRYCTANGSTLATGCAVAYGFPQTIYVVTDDPNAPARNITFSVVSTPTCPPAGSD